MDSFAQFKPIIDAIVTTQNELIILWDKFCKDNGVDRFNQRKKKVREIDSDISLSDCVYRFRSFLVGKSNFFETHLTTAGIPYRIRVKNINSIADKISRYMEKAEQGEIQINKCLNDILGLRIITEKSYPCDVIQKYILEWYGNNQTRVRVYDSSKPNEAYVGTHLYFHYDNLNFDWELQIWHKDVAITNEESHNKYKQSYTNWENESKMEEQWI